MPGKTEGVEAESSWLFAPIVTTLQDQSPAETRYLGKVVFTWPYRAVVSCIRSPRCTWYFRDVSKKTRTSKHQPDHALSWDGRNPAAPCNSVREQGLRKTQPSNAGH